jgi:hypothetical protein
VIVGDGQVQRQLTLAVEDVDRCTRFVIEQEFGNVDEAYSVEGMS